MSYNKLKTKEIDSEIIWKNYFYQQKKYCKIYACNEFNIGLEFLDYPSDYIPDTKQVSKKIECKTGWTLKSVNMLVDAKEFFNMLSDRCFPISKAIRPYDQIDFYTSDSPDHFHELFGHCPYLTNKEYTNCLEKFGKLACACDDEQLFFLERLFWYIFEIGLLITQKGIRILGATILSSKLEINQALNKKFQYNFELNKIYQSTYNVINVQTKYYFFDSLELIYNLVSSDLLSNFPQLKKRNKEVHKMKIQSNALG